MIREVSEVIPRGKENWNSSHWWQISAVFFTPNPFQIDRTQHQVDYFIISALVKCWPCRFSDMIIQNCSISPKRLLNSLYWKKKKKRIKSSNTIPFLQIATQIDFWLLKVSKGDGYWENNEYCSIRKAIYFKHFVQTFLISQGKTSHDFQEPSEEVSHVGLNRDTSLMPKLMEGSWPFSRQLCAILIRRSPAAVG